MKCDKYDYCKLSVQLFDALQQYEQHYIHTPFQLTGHHFVVSQNTCKLHLPFNYILPKVRSLRQCDQFQARDKTKADIIMSSNSEQVNIKQSYVTSKDLW